MSANNNNNNISFNLNEATQIYNLPEKNQHFLLQVKQLITYFNFRRKLEYSLKTGFYLDERISSNNIGKLGNNEGYIQNNFYLIDKNWLEQWKKHVGYNEIYKLINNRDLTNKDRNWIKTYIEKSSSENKLSLLDNKIIYVDEKIDPLSDFDIIDKECYKNFTFEFNQSLFNRETIKSRSYPVQILKEKILLLIDIDNYQIIFKDNKSNIYFEILIQFEQNNEGRKKTLDKIKSMNINNYIKTNNIDLTSEFNKVENFEGCKFKLINKTLKLYRKNQKSNCITPNMNNEEKVLLMNNQNLPDNLKDTIKKKMTYLTTINNRRNQNLNNNNNSNNIFNNDSQSNNNRQYNSIPQFNNNIRHFNNNIPQFNNNIQQFNNNIPQFNNNIQQFNNNFQQFNNNIPQFNNNIQQFNNNNLQFNNNIPFSNGMQLNNNIQFNNNNRLFNNNNIQFNNNLQFNNNQPNNFNNNEINLNNNNQNNNNKVTQHKTGLMNIGQTCYMNASIQSLSNILELSKQLLKHFSEQTIDLDKQPLTAAFSSLIYELYNPKENEKYIAPNVFKEIIGELNPLFKGMHAADAKDLIFFIIEKLHKELNPFDLEKQKTPQIDFEQQELNSTNEQLMLQLFFNDFRVKNNTIISGLFYGITRSTMKCDNCRITKYSFQTFNLLIFQLKKVKEGKLKQSGFNNFNEKLNLIDAFNVEKREEVLEGENMIYCNTCNGLKKGRHQQQIFMLPRIIIIVLNRGRNNADFNEKFEFPLILDFTGKNIIINQQSYHKYYLCGVITHLGESGSSGHFIAYCRDGPNSQFFCYNDASVKPADNNDVLKTVISSEDYEKKTPYVLFYHYLK